MTVSTTRDGLLQGHPHRTPPLSLVPRHNERERRCCKPHCSSHKCDTIGFAIPICVGQPRRHATLVFYWTPRARRRPLLSSSSRGAVAASAYAIQSEPLYRGLTPDTSGHCSTSPERPVVPIKRGENARSTEDSHRYKDTPLPSKSTSTARKLETSVEDAIPRFPRAPSFGAEVRSVAHVRDTLTT